MEKSEEEIISDLGVKPYYYTKQELISKAEHLKKGGYDFYVPPVPCEKKLIAYGNLAAYKCYPESVAQLIGAAFDPILSRSEWLLLLLEGLSMYDASVLNRLNAVNKKIIVDNAIKFSMINPTLSKLIKNNEEEKMPIVKSISKVRMCIKMSNHDKTIYLFGEKHSDTKLCDPHETTMSQYLDQLFKTTNKFIDFYLEIGKLPRFFGIEDRTPSDLDKIRIMAMKCTVGLGFLCPWKTSRTHYSDLRIDVVSKIEGENKFDEIVQSNTVSRVTEKLLVYSQTRKIPKYTEAEMEFLLKLKNIESVSEIVELLWPYLDEIPRLTKELRKTTIKNIKEAVGRAIEKDPFSSKVLKVGIEDFDKYPYFKSYILLAFYIGGLIFDIYTVARMFRKFTYDSTRPSDQHNIIVYSGARHTFFISRILLELDFEILENSMENLMDPFSNEDKEYLQCLDMSPFKQPLFS